MHPVFTVFGISIEAYGLFLVLAYLTALFVVRSLAAHRGLSKASFTDLCFLSLVTGLAGARLLFVLTNWDFYRNHLPLAFGLWTGGLVYYGGFLAAFPAAVLFLRWRRLPLGTGLDVLAPGLALGHAVGRLGCFFAGCCHGRLCAWPWGMRFTSEQVEPALRGQPIHPTQLYEAGGLLMLGLILFHLVKRARLHPGSAALAYLIGYAGLRLAVEFFRGDSIRGTLPGTPFSTSQGIALLLLAGGLLAGFRRIRRDQ